jgi:hypothetical protein
VTSARAICRHETIVITGPDRGTVSSSLILVGSEIAFHHAMGNPTRGVYNVYELSYHRR